MVVPKKPYMLYFTGPIKNLKNNFTHIRFLSYVMTLEPNTPMKWNSIEVNSPVWVFALARGPRHYRERAVSVASPPTPALTMAPVATENVLGTRHKKTSFALTSLTLVLLHPPSTLPMRCSPSWVLGGCVPSLSSCLAHWDVPLAETIQAVSTLMSSTCKVSLSLWYSCPRSLYFPKRFIMLLALLFGSFRFLEIREPGQ